MNWPTHIRCFTAKSTWNLPAETASPNTNDWSNHLSPPHPGCPSPAPVAIYTGHAISSSQVWTQGPAFLNCLFFYISLALGISSAFPEGRLGTQWQVHKRHSQFLGKQLFLKGILVTWRKTTLSCCSPGLFREILWLDYERGGEAEPELKYNCRACTQLSRKE